MNEHTDTNDEDRPQVIYVETERGLGARWRRTKENVQEAGRKWVSSSVDAELPPQVEQSVPDWARGAKGRTRLAVIAGLVMLAWIVALIWLIG